MAEITGIREYLKDLQERESALGGIFDFDDKRERLQEVELELADGDVWNDPERAQQLGKERSSLEQVVSLLSTLGDSLNDLR